MNAQTRLTSDVSDEKMAESAGQATVQSERTTEINE